MNRGKSVKWMLLVLVFYLSIQGSSRVVVPAATPEAVNPSPVQGAELNLPHCVSAPASTGTNYYVDSINGSDSNPGTSEDKPWQTLAPVHARAFLPGDVVHFKRGSSWTGGLVIDDSGAEGNPITFTTYDIGNSPVFRNPGGPDNWNSAIVIDANWVVVEGLLARDAHEGGVYIANDSDYNIVRDVEATNVGIGIAIHGQHNLVTRNYLHDLHMIENTPGGDDDFGAVGIWLFNSHNEVSYNTMVNCKADSYDYGEDGGAVEWWAIESSIEGTYVHHNWAIGNIGFLEVGSYAGAIRDTVVAYNVSVNNGWFGFFNLIGTFGTEMENFRMENNTIIQDPLHNIWATDIILFNADPSSDTLLMRNNLFHVDGRDISTHSGFTHDHNLYSLSDGAQLGFSLGEGEMITDPLLVDSAAQDFHLQPGSPAIDAGVDLGHSLDFDDRSVPTGTAPDIGAFEYGAITPPTPVPPTPTPSPSELIIDNTDSGFSASYSQDAWREYVEVGGQHYGDTHYYNRQIGIGEDTATWSFRVPQAGHHEVYAWWWEGSWRPTDVPYTVNHLGGATTVRVNQQANGGQWNLLGTFGFRSQGSVVLCDDVSSGQDIVADAVRLVYKGPFPWAIYLPVVVR